MEDIFNFTDEAIQESGIGAGEGGKLIDAGFQENVVIDSFELGEISYDDRNTGQKVTKKAIEINLKQGDSSLQVKEIVFNKEDLQNKEMIWRPRNAILRLVNFLRTAVPQEELKELQAKAGKTTPGKLFDEIVRVMNSHKDSWTELRVKVVYDKRGYLGVPNMPFIKRSGVTIPNIAQRMDETPEIQWDPRYDKDQKPESIRENDIDAAIDSAYDDTDDTDDTDNILDGIV